MGGGRRRETGERCGLGCFFGGGGVGGEDFVCVRGKEVGEGCWEEGGRRRGEGCPIKGEEGFSSLGFGRPLAFIVTLRWEKAKKRKKQKGQTNKRGKIPKCFPKKKIKEQEETLSRINPINDTYFQTPSPRNIKK